MIPTGKIILGTVQVGLTYGINNLSGKVSVPELRSILDHAKLNGIDTLDTAVAYGDSEEQIGAYHSVTDSTFKIITKVDRPLGDNWAEVFHGSLERLGIPIIDTIMFHSLQAYQHSKPRFPDILKKGRNVFFKGIGVSVYTNEELEALIGESDVDVVQMPFNLLDNASLRADVLIKLKEDGKIIHARSIFLQGLFYKDLRYIPRALASLKSYLQDIHRIAISENTELNALAIQYVCSKEYIDGIVIGVDNIRQLERNIQALNMEINKRAFEKVDSIRVNDPNLLNPQLWKIGKS